jgi:hypothetical protein
MPQRVVLYGSCQMEVIWSFLQQLHPDGYEYQGLPFYRYTSGTPLPDSLWSAERFIYQPLLNRNQLDSRKPYETAPIVQRLRESGIPCFGVPFLHFEGYQADFSRDPHNEKTVTPELPWGMFAYGMRAVMELRGVLSPHEIVERTKADDFLRLDEIIGRMNRSIEMLRENETECDVQVADWIAASFRNTPLFHSVNHPTLEGLRPLWEAVEDFLELPRTLLTGRPEPLAQVRPPTYPCVKHAHGIAFDSQPILSGQQIAYDDYLLRYAELGWQEEADARVASAARLTVKSLPQEVPAGTSFKAVVRVQNDSSCVWRPWGEGNPAVRIAYHWERNGKIWIWDGARTELPHALRPGEASNVQVRVDAPAEPGTYTLAWDLVVEGFAWFSAKGCVFPRSPVHVTASTGGPSGRKLPLMRRKMPRNSNQTSNS